MPAQAFNLEARIKTLTAILVQKDDQYVVQIALEEANGDWATALTKLHGTLPEASLQKLTLAHSLAEWTDDNLPVVRALAEKPNISSLRDVALQFNVDKLTALVQPNELPAGIAGATPEEKAKNFAIALHNKLFASQTSAVLQRMVQDAEVPIADATLRTGVADFLNNQPDFNIRTTSIYTALQHPDAFNNIADDQRVALVEQLKTLQRVQAISPVPEAVPALMKANITSAFRVAELTESAFLRAFSESLGEATAQQVYTNAINAHIRNEHALTTLRQTMRGTGLAIIDGQQTREERITALQTVADQKAVPLNLSTLFGSMDYCECEDCLSVYSPAAYFVDLLQFLRNNDLGPDPASSDTDPAHNKNIHQGIAGTPLEKLFRRRPDLGCLELTCENTFTVLPYIDLVNEVMESFVVHLGDYHKDPNDPKQATLEAFNVEDETSGELLAIPQHVNYEAYCTLKSAVYPFTLPYHQPIDATRIFLNYLGTSRWELLDTFRTPTESCPTTVLTPAEQQELQSLHQTAIDRAVDAEFLGMTQEEYIILTREAFWPKRYFDLTKKTTFNIDVYQQNIGVRPVSEYYGYQSEADMLSFVEDSGTGQKGLTFVKKQFLPRTGIQYTELVELLKTRFINPNFPQGQALTILESIRFSYRYLQSLVDTTSADPYAKLISFLEGQTASSPQLNALLHPEADPCHQQQSGTCTPTVDLRAWVKCYFERAGKLIVIESGQGLELVVAFRSGVAAQNLPVPLEGTLFDINREVKGFIHANGVITTKDEKRYGQVKIDLSIVGTDDKPLVDAFGVMVVVNGVETLAAIIQNGSLSGITNPDLPFDSDVSWTAVRDTCDLDSVRLRHLDGNVLDDDDYDRLQRFIRLWRKLGWSIDEVDKALSGLTLSQEIGGGTTTGSSGADGEAGGQACEYVGFDTFTDDCATSDGKGGGCGEAGGGMPEGCPEPVAIGVNIQPEFLHQLSAVVKLLDQTGLPLPKLLAFWADISTAGEKSLYSKLFLTHNLVAIDSVFKADANGNYLTRSAKITDHLPVLMAAFKLKADDITAIMGFANVADSLTLPNVSVLYRYSLLAKILHVRVPLLRDVVDLFGNPFKSAWDTVALLETWGKMEDAGFTFRQLDYLVLGRDDLLRPLAPSQKTLLQLAKTLYDGLNAIDRDHRDITDEDGATDDLIRAQAGLLFGAADVERVMGLLDGTTVYTTNAPTGLSISPPDTDTLSKKLKYTNRKDIQTPTGSVQVTGILTDAETVRAKALSNNPDWPKAIDRIAKQAKNVFNDVLFNIFPDTAEAQNKLLAGDFSNPNNVQDSANTAPDKRFYFLQKFLPFLRERLSQRLIVDTCSAAASLPSDVTSELLSDILTVGTLQQSAMAALEAIKTKPQGAPAGWQGYLIPATDADFTFVAIGDTQPPALILDGQSIPFTVQQEDPSNVWFSDPAKPTKLKSGKLYWLTVADRPAEELLWRTATTPSSKIPTSSLLPDYSSRGATEVFTKLYKAALLVNGFNLSADEVSYWQSHAADFDKFDFNAVTLQHWKRLQAYTDLRNNLPRTEFLLIDLFKWASQPDDPAKLSEKIAAATTWKKDSIDKLIAPDPSDPKDHFDLNHPEAFRNEVNLVKLRRAIGVADKIAVDIDSLFEWAKPGSKFWACHQIAEDIRKALRARFDEEDWEQAVKPLNDQLREHQKQALISYLLVQPDLIYWGVIDADSLFEFFLIDVQMDACMETSRIAQAIASVQLFIQRCLLGLEEKQNGAEVGVPNNAIDRDRWQWMQHQSVCIANKKVFIHPESYLLGGLRDDKSPFFKELESELMQKDINTQTVQGALKSYLIKVDEVANLKVVGLFLDKDGNRLHVFSKTRNAPYFFFYRYFQIDEKNWYPWEKIQVDIPSYDVESDGQTTDHGAYLIPVAWNGRLLIFFPQLMKKTSSANLDKSKTLKEIGEKNTLSEMRAADFLEIKMGWSEYRNGKWTQKQQSAKGIYDTSPTELDFYQFVPRVVTGSDSKIVIECYLGVTHQSNLSEALGAFYFQGSQIRVADPSSTSDMSLQPTDFHYVFDNSDTSGPATTIYSLQATNKDPLTLFQKQPAFHTYDSSVTIEYDATESFGPVATGVELDFYHPFAHDLLGQMSTGNLDDLFNYYLTHFNSLIDVNQRADVYGGYVGNDGVTSSFDELKRAYSLYNWEATFHAPMLLVDRMLKALQFEQALQMCHYVLNPFAAGSNKKRFWQFPPFMLTDAGNELEKLFLSLQPGKSNPNINEWRNKPFQPHVVARSRPAAYMMWVAMTYIRILIAWGDYLFRQNTRETINQATQLYVLAAHVYGPQGQKIPRRGKVLPETYNSLLDKWDAFGNAMVELELAFPFSNQTPLPIGSSNGVVGLANVFGFASTLYFCIPDNPDLTALRDTIDDRLFKIRHCENIEGVFQQLPLFEPPIDPALLVQAAAQGLSLSSVLNDLNSPMPNYRFYYLLQKALEVCNELKSLGNAFLSAKEKGDGEALQRLRATHDRSIQNLVMEVRKQQVIEVQKSLDSLQQSRKGPVYRLQHFLKLIGEDLSKVPNEDTDFGELPDQIEQPIDESGLKLIGYEKEEMDKAAEANDRQEDVGRMETLAGILHIIPDLGLQTSPFGLGPYVTFLHGLGNAAQAVARANQVVVGNRTFSSTNAGRKAGFLRQLQDRVQQANIAGYEIKNIDKQMLTQQIRIDIANQEITNQQTQIENAKEVEDFLRNKYTNQELYYWMEGQVSTLYYQAYTLAYDLAKRAEKAFRFERGLTTSNFIQYGYWDPAYDGLLAGERLYIGLKQLETAYQVKRGYDFEIVKNISLQQLNPLALIQLRETGRCEFELPEILFDMGYPGHYMRRIKSVALSVACQVGPPTSLNCTLRLLEHKFRINSVVNGKGDYPEHTDQTDDRFSTVNVPITSIAVSAGQNDSGTFELNFHDERYVPFEGAGAISKWRIELPEKFREFDYDSITDVVMHLRYTALDGGDKLRGAAEPFVESYVKSIEDLSRDQGLFAFFDIPHDFSNAWSKANQLPAGATERIIALDNLSERLPVFTKGTPKDKILATDIYLVTSAALASGTITLVQGTDETPLGDGSLPVGALKSFVAKDQSVPMTAWQVKIADTKTSVDQLWLVVRYTLG